MLVRRLTLGILLVAIAGWAAWFMLARGGDEAALRQAVDLVDRGAYEQAWPRLQTLLERCRSNAEYWFARGVCAKGLGRFDEAFRAWANVPARSRFAALAVAERLALARRSGQFAQVLDVSADVLPGEGPAAVQARGDLLFLLRNEGRDREAGRLLRMGLPRSTDVLTDLRTLWDLDHDPFPIHAAQQTLSDAAAKAPGDLGVRLGLANLALRQGNIDEARAQIELCRNAAPDSPIVTEAQLRVARTAGDLQSVCAAIEHIDAEWLASVEWLDLHAWLARHADDPAAEERALGAVLKRAPSHPGALERCAELATRFGQLDRARDLRVRKANRDGVERAYDQLVHRDEAIDSAASLADDARILGLVDEARAWLRLALRQQPANELWRRSLADLEHSSELENRSVVPARDEVVAACRSVTSRPRAEPGGPASIPVFEEGAAMAGLQFVFENGDSPEHQLPETMSGGVGLIDYDGDGRLDVYAAQGGDFPPRPGQPFADRLFRNRGDGTFEDATRRSGLSKFPGGYTHGVAVADVNNDGCSDIFITRWRSYALYVNKGDGTFEDATAAWNLDGERGWPTSAAFADLDGDGDLDLYVCHYVVWDEAHPRVCSDAQGRRTFCSPEHFAAEPDCLLRNDGDRFIDISESAGITVADGEGRGLGVVAADLDGDGRVDLFVANDTTANYFFRNKGDTTFEECALAHGVASNAEGGYLAGMGVACGDLDGDGLVDLAVTNYYGECTTFYRNLGAGQFADATPAIALTAPTRYRLGFGIACADMNNDGLLDLVQANGHVDAPERAFPYAMPAQLLIQRPNGTMQDAVASAGPPWQVPRFGRGLAVGDLDNDGRLDAILVDLRGPLAYLSNRGPEDAAGAFVTLELRGTASNRDAVGAVVTVECAGKRWVQLRAGGGSYLSAGDPRLHFGLGGATHIDRVSIHWPSGTVQNIEHILINKIYRIVEGSDPLEVETHAPEPSEAHP